MCIWSVCIMYQLYLELVYAHIHIHTYTYIHIHTCIHRRWRQNKKKVCDKYVARFHSLSHSLTHSLTHALTHSLIHSRTPSLVHSDKIDYSTRKGVIRLVYFAEFFMTFTFIAFMVMSMCVCMCEGMYVHVMCVNAYDATVIVLISSYIRVLIRP